MRFRVVFPVASGADCPNSSNYWLQEQQLLSCTVSESLCAVLRPSAERLPVAPALLTIPAVRVGLKLI